MNFLRKRVLPLAVISVAVFDLAGLWMLFDNAQQNKNENSSAQLVPDYLACGLDIDPAPENLVSPYVVLPPMSVKFCEVPPEDLKIDLNSAGIEELQIIPGIGQVTAKKIIHWRDEHGPFESIEQILKVSGIGLKKFESMKRWMTVNHPGRGGASR
ncbi:MAG: helix-hairpin-helix domain-containing protein [Candidatus Theseobacter exili]|nr:helix-hairpin-helix domain-containing protein [Candidatus Theseobacter exili]